MLAIDLPPNFLADAISAAHVLAAAGVTVHVLLKKQDVRASVGWIGLAWLSPLIGSLVYFFLGINRIERRAARLNRAAMQSAQRVDLADLPRASGFEASLATLAAVGDRCTGLPLLGGNAVAMLMLAEQAYRAMIGAIDGAEKSVALASYIFRADEVGLPFIEALVRARARGVEVRVLVDGIGGGYFYSAAVRRLQDEGVPVGRFLHSWLPWRTSFINLRSHKKLLIVDGATAFTGGLNIGAENLSSTRRSRRVNDVHFRIEGPVVRQLMETFGEDWLFTTGENLRGDAWWPALASRGPVVARGISSGPDEDFETLEMLMTTAIVEAKRQVRIVTPYFVPDQNLLAMLVLAAVRGIRVEIVIPRRSNHAVSDWACRAQLRFLETPGFAVFLSPRPFDHSKLMTVDGQWSLVGSANWDVRSLRLNFEFDLECYDRSLAAEIDALIDAKIQQSTVLSFEALDRQSLAVRLRDAAARLLLPYL